MISRRDYDPTHDIFLLRTNCATVPRPFSLSTLRNQLSTRVGGVFRRNNNCANAQRPFPLSTLRREFFYEPTPLSLLRRELRYDQAFSSRYDKTANSRTLLKTRLILGGSVRQQSLQYHFTTRLTALYSLLGVVATTTTRMVTTTGHHH